MESTPDNVYQLNPKPTPPPAARELLEYIRDQAQEQLDALDRTATRPTQLRKDR